MEIEQVMDEEQGLELNEENIETVLDEIRPYLVGELKSRFGQTCGPHLVLRVICLGVVVIEMAGRRAMPIT